jgi:hypothetical protein
MAELKTGSWRSLCCRPWSRVHATAEQAMPWPPEPARQRMSSSSGRSSRVSAMIVADLIYMLLLWQGREQDGPASSRILLFNT